MKIIQDESKRYKEDLRKILVDYNTSQIGSKKTQSFSFYCVKDNQLKGAMNSTLVWDWVSINELYYESIDALSELVHALLKTYAGTCEGVKHYTADYERMKDLRSVGFILKGETRTMGHTPKYYYLVLPQNLKKLNDIKISKEIVVSKEPIETFDNALKNRMKVYKKSKGLIENQKEHEVMFVALDGNAFIGGVYGVYSKESMYISSLAIKPKHRKKGIGLQLMKTIEDKAKSENLKWITLGTADFQALAFYKKLGYSIDLIKENDPKGHITYSLFKKI